MNFKIISRIIVTMLLVLASFTDASAQVVQKFGERSFSINAHAVLELDSDSKGFLPPRMNTSQQGTINPGQTEKGLIVYITDATIPGLQIWNGSAWVVFVDTEALDTKADATDLDGLATTIAMTDALATKADLSVLNEKANIASPTFTGTVGGITAAMVGLGNVENTTDANKIISTLTQTALDTKADATDLDGLATTIAMTDALDSKADLSVLNEKANIASPTFTGTVGGITAAMVGLGNVENTTDANKIISTLTQTALDTKADAADLDGLATTIAMTDALATKADVSALDQKANIASPTFTGTVGGITAAMVGLGNVENTTDADKIISTLTQTALDTKADATDLDGLATTIAMTDALDSKADLSALDGKANIASPTFTGTVGGITAAMVGLENVDNTTDANKAISTLTQTALNDKADATDLADKEDTANKSTDIALGSSDDLFPTQNAVKTYVDTKISVASFVTTNVAYAVLITDFTINCDTSNGGFLVTFDSADNSNIGKIYVINKTDITNNELSFSPGLKLKDDSRVTSLNYPRTVRVQSDGTDWLVIR